MTINKFTGTLMPRLVLCTGHATFWATTYHHYIHTIFIQMPDPHVNRR